MPATAFFVGPTAGLLWSMPLPRRHLADLHVGAVFPATPMRRPGVRGHRLAEPMAVRARLLDLPALGAPTAWASLGRSLSTEELVLAADALLWEPRNVGGFSPGPVAAALCTREDLEGALALGRWRGAARLREALTHARTGSRSPAESIARLRLAEAGLPEPELNVDIYEDDEWLANGDIVYPHFRVCVEYQGAFHRGQARFEADIDRQFRLRQAGWITIELTSHIVYRAPIEGVRRVRDALMSRGWDGKRPET